MRRAFGVLALCTSLILIGAVASPAPSPSPAPSAKAAPSTTPSSAPSGSAPVPTPTQPTLAVPNPTVIVYPFDSQGGLDAKSGNAIAEILSQSITAGGGITVPPIPKDVKRADFLDYAREHHADFYVAGYVIPVGANASVVEQVVSVDSGVILFSQTAQVETVADVASQGLLARVQILAFSGRNKQRVASTGDQTPAPTSTNGAQMQLRGISAIVDSVFGHHRPTPTPSPTPLKPTRGVIVAPIAMGTTPVTPADLKNATDELYFAINRHYNATTTQVNASIAKSADSICGSNRNETIAGGTLSTVYPRHGKPQITFVLQVYTCFGATIDTETGKGNSIKTAVDAAVQAYWLAHQSNS